LEKTLTIDGKEVRFKSTAATPLRFKAQFQKDYLAEIMKLDSLGKLDTKNIKPKDLEKIDFEVFYNIAWTLAKTADPSIKDPITWLDGFETFPLMEILPELSEMISVTLQGKKK
jgi:hypothetical protein